MSIDTDMEQGIASYKSAAENILAEQARSMQEEFPNEVYPVRPPYRRAMYQRLLTIVEELNAKMEHLLGASPDKASPDLRKQLMRLQEHYEQEFIDRVRKHEESERER